MYAFSIAEGPPYNHHHHGGMEFWIDGCDKILVDFMSMKNLRIAFPVFCRHQ